MLVPGEDGKYFHYNREYYVGLFRKVIEDKEFRYHELRRFVFDKSKMRIG
jgi:hypothetical protein